MYLEHQYSGSGAPTSPTTLSPPTNNPSLRPTSRQNQSSPHCSEQTLSRASPRGFSSLKYLVNTRKSRYPHARNAYICHLRWRVFGGQQHTAHMPPSAGATPQRRVTRSQSRELDDPNYGKQSSSSAGQRNRVHNRAPLKSECYVNCSTLTLEFGQPGRSSAAFGRPCL